MDLVYYLLDVNEKLGKRVKYCYIATCLFNAKEWIDIRLMCVFTSVKLKDAEICELSSVFVLYVAVCLLLVYIICHMTPKLVARQVIVTKLFSKQVYFTLDLTTGTCMGSLI